MQRPYLAHSPPTLRPYSEIDKVFEKWYYGDSAHTAIGWFNN